MKVADLTKKYKDQWIVVRPTKTDELGKVVEGELLSVGETSEDALKQVDLEKNKQTAHFFTGKVPPMMFGGMPITKKPKGLEI